jgi:hypothetical protein
MEPNITYFATILEDLPFVEREEETVMKRGLANKGCCHQTWIDRYTN